MKAITTLDVTPGRTHWQAESPVALRRTGADRMHLVQAAGGPLGGDDLRLEITVAAGCALRICSAGATVVQPGPSGEPAGWRVSASVGPGAELRWLPRPTVVSAGADLRSSFRAAVAPDAVLVVREDVVLGRHGEPGGAYRGELAVTVAGRPLLVHESVLDGADPDLCGPAGTGGHRVQGTLLVAAADVCTRELPVGELVQDGGALWSALPLDGPGVLVLALGDSVSAVDSVLDRAERSLLPSRRPGSASIQFPDAGIPDPARDCGRAVDFGQSISGTGTPGRPTGREHPVPGAGGR